MPLAYWGVQSKPMTQDSGQGPALIHLLALVFGAGCFTQISMFLSHVTQGHLWPNSQGDIKIGNNACKIQNVLQMIAMLTTKKWARMFP